MSTSTPTETADIVIIGGGAIGASVAFHVAQRRLGRVLLLERDVLGAGSTGRSVASVDLVTQHPCGAALHVRSLHAFRHCAELFGDECGWVQTGFAMVGGNEIAPAMGSMLEVVGAAGGQVERLSAADLRTLDPACQCDETARITWAPEGGYLDPVLLTNTLANAARARGVSVRQGQAVRGLIRAGERIGGVQTRDGFVAAGVVIVCAGVWGPNLVQTAGFDLPLRPLRHSVAVLACPPNASPRISVMDTANQVYARPETGGLTVCGSLDLAVGFDPIAADDACGPPSLDYGLWVWEHLLARYPGMAAGELRKGWSGPLELTPDGEGMIGPLPLDGLFCAFGFSGAGMKIAPAVGEAIASLIAGDQATAAALSPLRPTRFAGDQLLRSQFPWSTAR